MHVGLSAIRDWPVTLDPTRQSVAECDSECDPASCNEPRSAGGRRPARRSASSFVGVLAVGWSWTVPSSLGGQGDAVRHDGHYVVHALPALQIAAVASIKLSVIAMPLSRNAVPPIGAYWRAALQDTSTGSGRPIIIFIRHYIVIVYVEYTDFVKKSTKLGSRSVDQWRRAGINGASSRA